MKTFVLPGFIYFCKKLIRRALLLLGFEKNCSSKSLTGRAGENASCSYTDLPTGNRYQVSVKVGNSCPLQAILPKTKQLRMMGSNPVMQPAGMIASTIFRTSVKPEIIPLLTAFSSRRLGLFQTDNNKKHLKTRNTLISLLTENPKSFSS